MSYTSGCTDRVLDVNADYMFESGGKLIEEPHWPDKVEQWRELINEAAAKYDVPPALVAGVIAGESRGNPNAKSPVGATGLMQLMPQYFGGNAGNRLHDPATNVDLGTEFLRELLDRYQGNPLKVLAAYNAGSARCRSTEPDWGLVQNEGYVSKCLGYANEAARRGFSPRFPSDPDQPRGLAKRAGSTALAVGGVAAVLASLWWAESREAAAATASG